MGKKWNAMWLKLFKKVKAKTPQKVGASVACGGFCNYSMKNESLRPKAAFLKDVRVFIVNGRIRIGRTHHDLRTKHVAEMIIRGWAKAGKDGRVSLTSRGRSEMHASYIQAQLRLFKQGKDCDVWMLERYGYIRNAKITKKGK